MATRAKPGDVLEVTTPDGFIYLHYLGKHPEYGDGVAVAHGKRPHRVSAYADLFRTGYMIFYPATAAVARGMAEVVGHLPSGGLPQRLRRPGARSGAKVETWIVEDASGETVKRSLTPEERMLPIAVIWNHELLLQRVAEKWRPELEGAS
jgi:hypothetical protein